AHPWPGNIRELRNVIERAVILESSQEVQPSSLPDFEVESRLRQPVAPSPSPRLSNLGDTLIAFEREMVAAALQQHDGNLPAAAAQLGLTLEALQFRLGRLHMAPSSSLPGGPSSKGSS
ncbi:MAG: helix-turn-helix domain-containing protein, partial [Verrucomicrobiota bacterium]